MLWKTRSHSLGTIMQTGSIRRWWGPGACWTLAACLILVIGYLVVPRAAASSGNALLSAMATHTHWLNWAAGLMALIGWGDSLIRYRRDRHSH